MSVYLTLTPCGGTGHDGIGSVVYYQLLTYIISKHLGLGYSHSGFDKLSHYDYTKYSHNEWCDSFTKFFNFPYLRKPDKIITVDRFSDNLFSLIDQYKDIEESILIDMNQPTFAYWGARESVQDYFVKNIDTLCNKKIIDEIRNNLVFEEEKYFIESQFNISLHIRSVNPNDTEFHFNRELYRHSVDFNRYENLISNLKYKYRDTESHLHIHSQGDLDKFKNYLRFSSENFKISLHINQNPWSDIYHMANSDLLIMSNSSFSHIASLMNSNQIIVRDNFWHITYPNSIKVDYNYNILN